MRNDFQEALPRTVVLVEGESDKGALETLALRIGRDLAAELVEIVAMGGSKKVGRFLEEAAGVRVAGLCDVGEEGDFRRGLERAGYGTVRTRDDLERLGFFVCVVDLEDELIRALGAAEVVRIIGSEGELDKLRTFQKQPQWRDRPIEEQLRRFFGTYGGRKIRSAPRLAEALDLERLPRPLEALLAYV